MATQEEKELRKKVLEDIKRKRAAAAQAEGSLGAAEEGQYGDVGQGEKGPFDDIIDQTSEMVTTPQTGIGALMTLLGQGNIFLADKRVPFSNLFTEGGMDFTDAMKLISKGPDDRVYTEKDLGKKIGYGNVVTEEMLGQKKPLTLADISQNIGKFLFEGSAKQMERARDEGVGYFDMTPMERFEVASGPLTEIIPGVGFAPDIIKGGIQIARPAGQSILKSIDELTAPVNQLETVGGPDINLRVGTDDSKLSQDPKNIERRERRKQQKEGTYKDPAKVRVDSIEEGLNKYLELNYKQKKIGDKLVYEVDRNWKSNAIPFLKEEYGDDLIYKNEPFDRTKLTQLIRDNPKLKEFNVVVKEGKYNPTKSFYSYFTENFDDVIKREEITDARTRDMLTATSPSFRFIDFMGKTRKDLYNRSVTNDGADFSKLVEEYDPKKLEDPTYKHYEDFQRFKLIDEARIEANKLIKPVLKKIFKDNKNQRLEIAHKYESSGIASGYVSKAEEGTGGSPYSIYIDLSEINSGIQKTLEAEARELVGQYNKAVLAEKPIDNILSDIYKVHDKMVKAGVQGQAFPFILGTKDPTPIGDKITNLMKNAIDKKGIELTDEDLINANKAVDILNKYGDQAFETYGTRLGLRDGGLATMEYMTRPLNAQR